MSSLHFLHPRISSTPIGKSFFLAKALSGGNMSASPDVSTVKVTMPPLKTEFGVSTTVLGRIKS